MSLSFPADPGDFCLSISCMLVILAQFGYSGILTQNHIKPPNLEPGKLD